MKNEKIREFLTRLAQEEGFKDEFLKFKEKVEKKGFSKKDNEKLISEHLLPWSKKLGYELTKKDFIDFDRTQKPTEITGLTAEQLENVSGGGFTMLLALFATFGSALAGFAGGGGTTGNNAKTNDNFGSTDLTFSYSSGATSSSGDVSLASYKQTGIDSIDYYNSNYWKTPADFYNQKAFSMDDLSSGAGVHTEAPLSVPSEVSDALDASLQTEGTSQQTRLVGNAGQYGKNIGDSPSTSGGALDTINMRKDVRAAESDKFKAVETQVERGGGSGQVSIYTGLDHFGNAFSAASAGGESMSTAPEPKPAGDVFSPINPSTWREAPAQGGSTGGKTPRNQNASDEHVQAAVESEIGTDSAQFTLDQNLFSHSGTPTPTVTPLESGGHEPIPGVFSRIADWWRDSRVARSELKKNSDTDKKTNFDGFEGTPEEIAQHNYARSSPGDYDWTTDPENFKEPFERIENTVENKEPRLLGWDGYSSTPNGQSWKDVVKGTAQMTGIAAGLGAAALGSVYAAGAGAAASASNAAVASQKNAHKTKETTSKTENKKATKETKKDGNDFMRSFMENLQKNSPEASQYLNSLKY